VVRNDYRDAELPALFRELGTQGKVAEHLGINRLSLNAHINKDGNEVLRASISEAVAEYNAARSVPSVDVTTAEGRRAANRNAEIAYLRKENKRVSALLLDQENLVDRVINAAVEPRERPRFKPRTTAATGDRRRDVVLPLFDMQFGSKIIPEDTIGGIGGFDTQIFRKRMQLYVDKVTARLVDYGKSHTYDSLIFAFGGDLVEGDEIFPEQVWQLELNPVEQVVQLVDILEGMVHEIMGVAVEELGFGAVSAMCVLGNHGRVGGKRKAGRGKTYSWDYLVCEMLKTRMKNYPWHRFEIEKGGACYFDSKGHTFAMIHGDQVKGWGGIPFYGLTRHDAKLVRTLSTVYDYLLLGHHHQPASIPIGFARHLMSGNWVGGTNLSEYVGSNIPSQNMYFVSENYGAADSSEIFLQTKDQGRPLATVHSV
jgi:hypothetical protein